HVPGVGELTTILGALLGASLGFLWYNAPPARVFMGDTGSLALGGLLGAVAVATKHEIVLAIIGGLFVLETLSVMVQVAVYKRTGKRVFLMAPIHHHFEKLGWQEPTIVIRFWIISVIFALAGLATLKVRLRCGATHIRTSSADWSDDPDRGICGPRGRRVRARPHRARGGARARRRRRARSRLGRWGSGARQRRGRRRRCFRHQSMRLAQLRRP